MTSTQLKAFFRQFFKIAPGGPASGPAGKTRSIGILTSLDKLVDETERAFVPLEAGELDSDKARFANHLLRPLLIEVASAISVAGPSVFTYQASYTATPAERVVLAGEPRTFAVVASINASGFQAQVVKTTDSTAWGPVRTVAADVTADLTAAFADASTPATVLLLVQPTRTDASRAAFTLYTLS